MEQFLVVCISILITILIPIYVLKEENSTRIKNRLRRNLRSKYPYMSDEDIDKMVCKTLRIK